jgi:succinate dehydrogenase / fumarate reductase, membrane anchor subunit
MADTEKTIHVDVMRSQLGRVRGLGSAKSGVAHWWAQRLTAIALVPLSLWFIFSMLHLLGAPQAAVADWFAGPWTIVLMLALVLATFHHLQLGLQVVIEDYIHDDAIRLASLLAMKAVAILLAMACVVSVLKLGL